MTRALVMNRPGNQLFSGSIFTGDQNPAMRRRGSGDLLPKFFHCRRIAHQFGMTFNLNAKIEVFLLQVSLMKRVSH